MSNGDGLPTGWERRRIDELGAVQLGRQRSPGKRSDKFPTKYLRAANVTWNGLALDDVLDMDFTPTERETFRLRSGDILLSEASGSASEVGKPALWNDELELCCFQNTLIRFRPNALTPRYALHLFSHLARSGIFVKASRGVGIHHIGAQRFSALDVPVPPQAEQERIADRVEECLSDLAAGVAALERVRKKLKRYRSSVLHAAVTGRLTEAWRKEHGAASPKDGAESGEQLLERLLVERRRQWEARTLADYEAKGKMPPKNWRKRYIEPVEPRTSNRDTLPSGWVWATVEQITRGDRSSAYGVLKPGPNIECGVPLIRIGDIENGRVDVPGLKRIAAKIADQFKRTFIEGGELLMSLVGTIGRTAIAPVEAKGANTARAVGVIPLTKLVSNEYVEYWFRNPTRVHEMTSKSHEVARKTLNLEDVRPTLVAIPPINEQHVIVAVVQEKLSQIDVMEAEVNRGLARAARLRQAILKFAFAGELVPQDPSDEPASVLLERIRTEREAAPTQSNGRPKRAARKKAAPMKKVTKSAKRKSTKKKTRKS